MKLSGFVSHCCKINYFLIKGRNLVFNTGAINVVVIIGRQRKALLIRSSLV